MLREKSPLSELYNFMIAFKIGRLLTLKRAKGLDKEDWKYCPSFLFKNRFKKPPANKTVWIGLCLIQKNKLRTSFSKHWHIP